MDSDERPIGELVSQLIDEGKAYAEAEVALAKAKALGKACDYRRAAILGGVAGLFLLATFVALGLTLVLSFAALIGPTLGGLVAIAILAGIGFLVALAAKNSLPGDRG